MARAPASLLQISPRTAVIATDYTDHVAAFIFDRATYAARSIATSATSAERPQSVKGPAAAREYLVHVGACHAVALELPRGSILRIIDVAGQQVADVIAFNSDDTTERLNNGYTQLANGSLKPHQGDVLFSSCCRPMMTILSDAIGQNYMSGAQCSEPLNRLRYGVAGTSNCRDNFVQTLQPWGIPEHELPGSFSAFMNIDIGRNGAIAIREPTTRSGDYIDLRAEMDLLIAVSACPQDKNACNGWRPTPIDLIVRHPGTSGVAALGSHVGG